MLGLALFALVSVDWTWGKIPIPRQLYSRLVVLVSNSVHPNVLAGTLILFLPLAAIGLVQGRTVKGWALRVLAAGSLASGGAALLLSQSRGATLALGVAAIVFFVLRLPRARWLALALIGVGIFEADHFWGTQLIRSLIVQSALVSGNNRVDIWARTLAMLQDFPLTGIGLGQFGPAVDFLYPFINRPAGLVFHAHNLFLQVAVDLGLPGLVAWSSIFFLCLAAPLKYGLVRRNENIHNKNLSLAIVASLTALGIHGLFDAVTWGMVRSAPFVWTIWALGIASLWWANRAIPLSSASASDLQGNRL